MRRPLKIGLGLFGAALGGLAFWVYPTVRDLRNAGFLDRPLKNRYVAGREENLRAIRAALLVYHDSEEAFPTREGWVAALTPRLRTADLSEADVLRKITRPDQAWGPGKGYAIPTTVAGRYRGDLKGPDPVILFETEGPDGGGEAEFRSGLGRNAITLKGRVLNGLITPQ